MKTKILFPRVLFFIPYLALLFLNCNSITTKENVSKSNIQHTNSEQKKLEATSGPITCEGEKYTIYPIMDKIQDKNQLDFFQNIPKIEASKSYWRVTSKTVKKDVMDQIFSDFNGHLKTDDFILNLDSRFDGEKLAWTPVGILPTNGKFIMVLWIYWEKEAYEPSSKGYYLSTYNLKGDLLSFIYAYGHEEFISNEKDTDIISSRWGRAYCLNTDKPIIRKAINWDSYINRGGLRGTTIEVKELVYSINNNGYISITKENTIFPKTHVEWEDRSDKSFEEESITIKKLLGEF